MTDALAAYRVMKVLRDASRDPTLRSVLRSASAADLVQDFEVHPLLAKALLDWDLRTLVDSGVHGLSLRNLPRIWGSEEDSHRHPLDVIKERWLVGFGSETGNPDTEETG